MSYEDWPKYINVDKKLVCLITELMASCHGLSSNQCKDIVDHLFVGWLSEWYPELFEEYNRVLSGELGYDELPQYDLVKF